MRRTIPFPAVLLGALVVGLAGCGVQPTGVRAAGEAPTGLAEGVTLYFVDEHGDLRPQVRRTGRLGSVTDAVSLLLTASETLSPGLHTEIADVGVTRVERVPSDDSIGLRLPLSADEVTPIGIDQIVCTAVVSQLQAGGSRSMPVRLSFTIPEPGSDRRRFCPLLDHSASTSTSGAVGAGSRSHAATIAATTRARPISVQ